MDQGASPAAAILEAGELSITEEVVLKLSTSVPEDSASHV